MAIGAVCEEGYARLREKFNRWRVPSAIVDDLVDYRNTISYPRAQRYFSKDRRAICSAACWRVT